MKIIVAPDKFKGSLTSLQVCDSIKAGILQSNKNAEVCMFPMADGGDGFAAVLKYYLKTETIQCNTVDPLMREMIAAYEWDEINKSAIIELASASGLMLLKENERNPLKTSTYGTGLLIKHAIEKGAEKIILGIGGSATNDAGIGILSALGFTFAKQQGDMLKPTGENLSAIDKIGLPSVIPNIQFIIATDVSNILFGREGAAFVYAPQKGADENAVKILDNGLQHFATLIKTQTKQDIANFPGAGAAGGVAFGLSAFFRTEIISGAKFVATASKIENQLTDSDMIITGEGKLDAQSSKGKVVHQITLLAKRFNIPVVALCGEVCVDKNEIKRIGLQSACSLVDENISKEEAIKKAAAFLQTTAALLFKQ